MAPSEKIIVDETEISDYIPQEPPMVMIGKLLDLEGERTVTSFIIREGNLFCEKGRFLEAGLLENMAQTAAAGVGYMAKQENKLPPTGFIGGIKNLCIHSLPFVGDEIRTEITIQHRVFDATVANGKVYLLGEVIAECELKIFLLKGENHE
jgi:predicted hotdog family 3-hydroxylacyl-ACP dehydratase